MEVSVTSMIYVLWLQQYFQSQVQATQEEVLGTLNLPNNTADQFFLDSPTLCHWVQASFDMGWQIQSSGGKYASRREHALLIAAVSKNKMDSIIFNKKCGVCS